MPEGADGFTDIERCVLGNAFGKKLTAGEKALVLHETADIYTVKAEVCTGGKAHAEMVRHIALNNAFAIGQVERLIKAVLAVASRFFKCRKVFQA